MVYKEDPNALPETAKKLAEDLGERARLIKVVPTKEPEAETLPLFADR